MQERSQKPHTILVIEDEPDMLQLLERILTSEGYRVILAVDGVYGMTLLREAQARFGFARYHDAGPRRLHDPRLNSSIFQCTCNHGHRQAGHRVVAKNSDPGCR